VAKNAHVGQQKGGRRTTKKWGPAWNGRGQKRQKLRNADKKKDQHEKDQANRTRIIGETIEASADNAIGRRGIHSDLWKEKRSEHLRNHKKRQKKDRIVAKSGCIAIRQTREGFQARNKKRLQPSRQGGKRGCDVKHKHRKNQGRRASGSF